MKESVIEIKGKLYNVKMPETLEEYTNGLRGVTDLPENEGMYFTFPEEGKHTFNMNGMSIPLDIIYINKDDEVVSVNTVQPNYPEITDEGIAVLELNADSGVEIGDRAYRDDIESDENIMYVLDSNGNPQMELKGGERLFSRKNTITLIRMAKRANKSKRDADYKALGKKIFSFLNKLDSNEILTIELPE